MMGNQKIYRTKLGAGYYLDISFEYAGGNIYGKQREVTAVVTGPNNYKDIFTLQNAFTEEAYDVAAKHMASYGITYLSEAGEGARDIWDTEEQNAKDKLKSGSSFVGITEEAYKEHFKIDVTKYPQKSKPTGSFVITKPSVFDIQKEKKLEEERRTHKNSFSSTPIDKHPQHKLTTPVSIDYLAMQEKIKEADSIWERNRKLEKEAEDKAYNNFVKRHKKELSRLSPWVEEYGTRAIRDKMQGLVFAEKKEGQNFYKLKTPTKEVPLIGITKQVQHALGIRYDLVQSQWNPYGYKRKNGKSITESIDAMERGSRIHAYVDKGVKNGTWKVNPYDSNFIDLVNTTFPKKESVRKALSRSKHFASDVMDTLEELSKAQEVLTYLHTHYPETAGWKIKTEYTVSDYREYASSIDILAVNDRLKEAVIIDLKTGKTKVPYVAAQTSVYASFLRHNDATYGGYKIKTGVIDFSNSFGGVSLTELNQLSDEDVNKMLYTRRGSTVGFMQQKWQKKGRTIHEGFNISSMRVAPFATENLESVFDKRALGKDNYFSQGDIVSFDLETVPLSNGRMAIRSASLLNLYQRRNEAGIVSFHYKDKNALWEKAFLSKESFNSTSILTIDQINALETNKLSDAAVRAFEKAHAGMEGHHKKGIAQVMTSSDILDIMQRMKGKTVIGHNILNFDFSVMLYTGMSLAYEEGGASAQDKFIQSFNDAFSKMSIIDTLELAKILQDGYKDVLPSITNEALLKTFSPATYAKLNHILHQSSTDVLVTAKNLEVLMNGMTATERDILFNIIKGTRNKYIVQAGGARWMDRSEQKEGVGFNLNITNSLFIGKPAVITETQHWTVRAKNKNMTEQEKQARIEAQREMSNLLSKYGVYLRREGNSLIFESTYQDEKNKNLFEKITNGAFSQLARVTKDRFGRLTAYLQGYDSIILSDIGDGFMATGNSSFTTSSLNTFLDETLANTKDKEFLSSKFGAIKEVANVLSAIMEKHARGRDKFELLSTMLGKLNPEQAQWLYLHTNRLRSLYTIDGTVDEELRDTLKTGLELKLGTTPEQITRLILSSTNRSLFGRALGVTTPEFMKKISSMSSLRRSAIKGRIPTIKAWFDYYNSKEETDGLFGEAIQGTDFIERLTYNIADIPKAFRSKYEELSKSGAFDALASGIAEEQLPLDTGTQIQQTLDKYREAMLMDNPEAYKAYSQGYRYTPGTATSSDEFLDYYRNVEKPKKESEALIAFREAWDKAKYQNHVAKLAALTDYTAKNKSDAQIEAWTKETGSRKFNAERFITQNIMFSSDKQRLLDATNAAKVSSEEYAQTLNQVHDNTVKLNRVLGTTVGTLKSIPFYNPDQLFAAGYHQIGSIHKSLTGVIPGFLNTSVTKMLMGGVQDYELGWQKWKYGIKNITPALSLVGGTLGAVAGAPFGASMQMGAMGASAFGGLGAWASQIVGNRYERAINETGLFFSSRFNKMGAMIAPAIAALNLFTKALKIASVPLLAGLGSGLYMYKRALNNMGTLDTPLYNLTGINYGMGYNQLSRLDYTFGMKRGTTNNIIEGVEFAKQGLLSLGRYDKNKLISSALLGIFNEAYMNPGNGASNYAAMTSKLYENYQNSKNKGRFMYLLNEYNPELAKQLQIRTEYESFLASDRGAPYRNRRYYYNDINRDQRNEFRAITGIQSSFGESIQNSFMKIAAALYNWKGFDFMNRYTSVIGNAADAFAGGDINGGFKIIGDGIIDFIDNLGKTWAEVKEKLGVSGLKDTILTYGKIIYHEIKLKLIDLGLFVTDIFGKLKDPAKGFFMFLYEQFKKLFDFVGQIRLNIDLEKLAKGDLGGLQFKVGYGDSGKVKKIDDYSTSINSASDRIYFSNNDLFEYGLSNGVKDKLNTTFGVHKSKLGYNVSYYRREEAEDLLTLYDMVKQEYGKVTDSTLTSYLSAASAPSFNWSKHTDWEKKKRIVAKAARLLEVEPASSALDKVVFPNAEDLLNYFTGGRDIGAMAKDKLEEAKEKETKLILEFKNDQGKSEQHELIIGQQTGIVEVFGPNWKWGVR